VRNIVVKPKAAGTEFEHIARGAATKLLVGNEGGRRHAVDKRRRGRREGGRGGNDGREGGRVREVELKLSRRPEVSMRAAKTRRVDRSGRVRRGEGNLVPKLSHRRKKIVLMLMVGEGELRVVKVRQSTSTRGR